MKSSRFTMLFIIAFGLVTPTALAADDGFTPIFDGKTLDGWEQKGGKAKYRVEGGAIVGQTVPNTPNSFLCTKKHYSNFVLEYEFRCDDALNSGVQIRSNAHDEDKTEAGRKIAAGRVHGYQVEIDPNKPDRMWTGGIYDEGRRGWLYPGKGGGDAKKFTEQGKKLYKKGEWNKVRVEAVGDSIKTYLNGELRADLKDDLTPSGFIGLQVHGVGGRKEPLNVSWRNLRIKEVEVGVTAPAEGGNVRALFNGKDLTGWTATPGGEWKVENVDGRPTIVGKSPKSDPRHGILLTDKQYEDFTVSVLYKIMKGNSGLYFRVERVKSNVNVHGFQAEMDENNDAGGLYETGGRAWVVQPKAEKVKEYFHPYEWNRMTVTARGGHIVVTVNGTKTADLKDDPGRRKGHIGLQLHGGQDMHVMFRDVRIHEYE